MKTYLIHMDEELRLEAQRYMDKNYLKSFSALVRYALLMLLRKKVR